MVRKKLNPDSRCDAELAVNSNLSNPMLVFDLCL